MGLNSKIYFLYFFFVSLNNTCFLTDRRACARRECKSNAGGAGKEEGKGGRGGGVRGKSKARMGMEIKVQGDIRYSPTGSYFLNTSLSATLGLFAV